MEVVEHLYGFDSLLQPLHEFLELKTQFIRIEQQESQPLSHPITLAHSYTF